MVEKMSFLIKNNEVWEKYEDIWNVIKNKLNIKFHSQPIYENKYLKVKVRAFDGNTVFFCFFFYKRYFKHLKHKQKHLTNI